jgi:hypothetical protein
VRARAFLLQVFRLLVLQFAVEVCTMEVLLYLGGRVVFVFEPFLPVYSLNPTIIVSHGNINSLGYQLIVYT